MWLLWERLGISGSGRVRDKAARRELRYVAVVVGRECAAGFMVERRRSVWQRSPAGRIRFPIQSLAS